MIAYSVLAGSLLLVGCGGGGGEEDEASNDRTSRITYISLNNADIREGSENGELEVQVSLTERAGSPVTIDYETRDGTAVAGEDYQSKSGSLTIPEGDSRGSFTIPIIGDEIHEPDETFEVVLSDPSNARLNSSDAVGTVTIENDDTPPAITFDSRKQSVSEDVGTTRILATLSEESGFAISATLAVSGTALAGGDYTLDTPVTLEFAPGDLEASVDVEILQDNIPEGGETINVEFGELDYASLPDRDGNTEHSIIILGDTTLSDTGLSTYSDGIAADLTVEPSSHPDQDASFGRDAEFEPDFDGHEGFSFTKLTGMATPCPPTRPSGAAPRTMSLARSGKISRPRQTLRTQIRILARQPLSRSVLKSSGLKTFDTPGASTIPKTMAVVWGTQKAGSSSWIAPPRPPTTAHTVRTVAVGTVCSVTANPT